MAVTSAVRSPVSPSTSSTAATWKQREEAERKAKEEAEKKKAEVERLLHEGQRTVQRSEKRTQTDTQIDTDTMRLLISFLFSLKESANRGRSNSQKKLGGFMPHYPGAVPGERERRERDRETESEKE